MSCFCSSIWRFVRCCVSMASSSAFWTFAFVGMMVAGTLTSGSASWTRRRSRVDMLSSAALDAAIEALPEEGALLPLQLSPAVAALQCAISTGVLREGHVAVQSIYRLCLQLFKAE
ncbi:hypothetical protein M885DRAFT_624134 [Pelagophyceae sp. CCMP2097]|nr:hypothetical protein M885DRAFT_624134 [Pelagophyceae sp. CCMP2097]